MEGLIKYGENKGNVNMNAPDYACAKSAFVRQTDKPDGSTLVVVDEAAHKVDRYCFAFNGFWTDL